MSGFPTRTARSGFGPTLKNKKEVSDPTTEIGEASYNLAWWQTGGLSQVAPMAVIKCSVSGGVITVESQALAFDPNSEVAPITFTYNAVGWYSFAFASQYPDQRGVNVALSLIGGFVTPQNTIPYKGDHTGSNNASILTDSSKTWATNELAGKILSNITDGSTAIVVSNTTTTVTGTLSGGTDNDWDTGDVYVITEQSLEHTVSMTSSTAGDISFGLTGVGFVDPGQFLLVLY